MTWQFQPYHLKASRRHSFRESARHAVRGIASAIVYEANVRRQVLFMICALLLAMLLHLPFSHTLIVFVVAMAVLVAELFNSSLEAFLDAVHPDFSEHIELAKDMSAGAVLLVSVVAMVIGIVIFLPPLVALL